MWSAEIVCWWVFVVFALRLIYMSYCIAVVVWIIE